MADATTAKAEGKRPKRKSKGKQKQKDYEEEEEDDDTAEPAPAGYVNVDNKGRCALCQKDGVICQINLAKIEKWRKELESRKLT